MRRLLCSAGSIAVTTFAVSLVYAVETINGWQLSDADYERQTIAALNDAVRARTYKDINSVVVIRDGALLVEQYYNGASREQIHNPRSVGKTFAAAVLGIALHDGHITSIGQTLSEYYDLKDYAHFSSAKEEITLEQLLTMTSGMEGFDFDPDSPGNEENMYPTDDWVTWTLNLPMSDERGPGDEWRYFTAGIVVLGDVLNRVVPGGLEAYAHEKLFAPLGISDYEWQHTPQRVANTAGGIQLTPLDFAKFGQLHKNRGRWGRHQLIPAGFVDTALRPHVQTTATSDEYGYLWWHKTYTVDGSRYPVAYCSGNGGNKIFVFDDIDLVVVITASAYGRRYAHSQVDEMMTDYILPAVLPQQRP